MPQSTAERLFIHTVDIDNIIESVNADWLAFALENDTQHLSESAVVGQPLFRYLGGTETQHLYRLIIDRVRRTKKAIAVPFRCDGPAVRRYMELTIEEFDRGKVRFCGRVVREEPREVVPLLDPAVNRSDDYVVVCAWCKQIGVKGVWLEVEEAVARLKLFGVERLPQMKQGVCPACSESMGNKAGAAG